MGASDTNSASIFHPLVIERIIEITRDFKIFVFNKDHRISYKAGQFITLVDISGSREIRRSYSIISSPDLAEPLAIAVKRIANGFFSRKLINTAKQGDLLLTTGAAGFFQLPENMEPFTRVCLFAAGSGIAPILSILKTLVHLRPHVQVYLIYSNHSRHSTAFYQELKHLEKEHSRRLHVEFLFSSLPDLRKARLNRELLLEILLRHKIDRKKTLFFICGPENYMRMVIFLLLEEGFPKENIKKEDFNPGTKKSVSRLPPGNSDYRIQIELKGAVHNFLVSYPDSILQAAKKSSLDLPYSCETGKCGSCAAICVSGKVWLSNNEVLTEQDLDKGFILTCTGYPQDSDLYLKIS
jgi:ferredoxin-NADP reductase